MSLAALLSDTDTQDTEKENVHHICEKTTVVEEYSKSTVDVNTHLTNIYHDSRCFVPSVAANSASETGTFQNYQFQVTNYTNWLMFRWWFTCF